MPYTTVSAYVARYGERETAQLTAAMAPGAGQTAAYDSAKVEGAIETASEVVDSYVGKLYKTPIADSPRLVVGWVQSLAREELFVNTGRSNETVTGSADRARAQLLQVSRGDLALPIALGSDPLEPIAGGLGYAASSMDRGPSPFSNGGLDGFTTELEGGYVQAGCWRSRG